MSRLLNILVLVGLAMACGPSRSLPEGAPETMRSKELKELVREADNQYTSLRIRTQGNYRQGGSSQSFRLEARILRDSLVWLDIADPILGIKVARAVLTKDSVAFYNRLEKEYITGDVARFQEQFKLDFGFEELQAILSANLLFQVGDSYELYYRTNRYLFSDIDPEKMEDAEAYFSRERISQVFVDPEHYKPVEQVLNEPSEQRSYSVEHSNYSSKGDGFTYPEKIEIRYRDKGAETAELTIEIRDVTKDDPQLNFPFNIPSGYAKAR